MTIRPRRLTAGSALATLILFLAVLALPAPASAQGQALPAPAPAVGPAASTAFPTPWLAPQMPAFGTIAAGDTLPCPDCHPPKHFWAGAGELMLVQLLPWSLNSLIRNKEWAKIGPDSWEENLENPWVWDNNAFLNNQFSHPYHGNLYFNAARTNGYNFWQSAPWAFGGSLMWELFFERWAPAPNDFLNTSLGGINLGEMLFRMSSLTLDNTATGSNRVWREIGATLINPIRGFNRLVRGQMNDHVANPPDWRPSTIQAAVDFGWRHISGSSSLTGSGSVDQAVLNARLFYGSLVDDVRKAPFSAFRVGLQLSSNNGGSKLAVLTSRGTLGGWNLRETDRNHQVFGVLMNYDYLSNPAFEYGGQSFSGGWLSRWTRGDVGIHAEVLAHAIAIGATRSDYYIVQEGRNYDYGPGLGGSAELGVTWLGKAAAQLSYVTIWTHTINGSLGDHYQSGVAAEVRGYIAHRYGLGVRYLFYHERSVYDLYPTVTGQSPQIQVFATLAVPKWTIDE
jgi:hypothetical protein